MGTYFSSRSGCEFYPVTVTDNVINQTANKPAPPPKEEKKCSTEQNCKLEQLEVKSLETMVKMDEELDKKLNVSTENFNTSYESFMKNCGHLLSLFETPTFTDERKKVEMAFTGTPDTNKDDVTKAYKESVDAALKTIAERRARDTEPKKEEPKKEEPKKK